ncbi:hypothetical protein LNQ52_31895 [Klebsiella pneumoniae subsp. pneumoniae]|nr:hypothetical protein [Klebsiella pneumoniae subsp. pneumoniae]
MAKKWQLGTWLDDAGSKASGRYQAGGALYPYDLTTLNDAILYLSGGGDIEFNQHNDGNHNGSLYYSIPFGYWTLKRLRGIAASIVSSLTATGRRWIIRVKSLLQRHAESSAPPTPGSKKPPPTCGSPGDTSHYYFGGR